ncbi:MAG: hypothetical protein BWY06_00909 [Candidatus Latescibacteria bacterium ADurb.Bin168]|nr:MAG: hypothetical protein BWY06_00909 [Candidatus Latescibacteria bacterium ADurb.Bin168]
MRQRGMGCGVSTFASGSVEHAGNRAWRGFSIQRGRPAAPLEDRAQVLGGESPIRAGRNACPTGRNACPTKRIGS